jgi:TonB family protein
MSVLAMAMLLAGAGETQPAPSPEPPPAISIQFLPYTAPAPVRITGLMPAVNSAPSPLPRAMRPTRRAKANLEAYFSADDYPARALRETHEGTVAFRLDVDPAGRVATCTVTVSSGSQVLDSATCRMLRARPHFIPARMADGSAVPDTVRGNVRWRMREDEGRGGVPVAPHPARLLTPNPGAVTDADYPHGAPPLAPRGSRVRVAIGREGRVIGCDLVGSSGSAALDAAACPLYAARARFEPARNLAGGTVCDMAWGVVWWSASPADRPAPRRSLRGQAVRIPGRLRAQPRVRHCPGWSPE